MSEVQSMAKEVRLTTVILTLLLTLLSAVAFPGMGKSIPVGIIIGALTGLIGFNMILRMASHIQPDMVDVKARAYRSYLHRYLVYAGIFALSISQGVNAIALLAGMLAHKASFLIYTWRHRKEDG